MHYKSISKHGHIPNQWEEESPTNLTAFKFEIEELRNQLENLEKFIGKSVIKQLDILSFSYGMNASDEPFENF